MEDHTADNVTRNYNIKQHKTRVSDAIKDTLMEYLGPKLKAMKFPIVVHVEPIEDIVLKNNKDWLMLTDFERTSIRNECVTLLIDLNLFKTGTYEYKFDYDGNDSVVITGTRKKEEETITN